MRLEKPSHELRRGWTTGACATAAAKAAFTALVSGSFPDPVEITLPRGERVSFALALEGMGPGFARAGIIKDAGDDPDVTHGALVVAEVRLKQPHEAPGISFVAGEGVGVVTKPGLALAVGEAAINPVPRAMMVRELEALGAKDLVVEISIPEGKRLAEKTWNPRLGIIGGLSILGTTGIVHPFSCSAWIASLQQGVDVARALGLTHLAGSTGSTSEKAVQAYYDLPDQALLDMGDFIGGLLKYLIKNPVQRLTIAGGFGKITKLAQGAMDLHSGRSQVDFEWLAALAAPEFSAAILAANTAQQVLEMVGPALGQKVADLALARLRERLRGAPIVADVMIISRAGELVAHAK